MLCSLNSNPLTSRKYGSGLVKLYEVKLYRFEMPKKAVCWEERTVICAGWNRGEQGTNVNPPSTASLATVTGVLGFVERFPKMDWRPRNTDRAVAVCAVPEPLGRVPWTTTR
jgi:hypothetical protein